MPTTDKKTDEIMKRYLDLPEDIQKALFAPETSNSILATGKKHGLAIDKTGELADETGLVMLGITPPSEYIKNLVKRLGVDAEKAKEIAEDINQKVFSPIRESLKKIHRIEEIKPVEKLHQESVAGSENSLAQSAISTIRKTSEVPTIFVKKIPVMEPKAVPNPAPLVGTLATPAAPKKPMASTNPLEIKQELEKMLNPSVPAPKKIAETNEEATKYIVKDYYREPID